MPTNTKRCGVTSGERESEGLLPHIIDLAFLDSLSDFDASAHTASVAQSYPQQQFAAIHNSIDEDSGTSKYASPASPDLAASSRDVTVPPAAPRMKAEPLSIDAASALAAENLDRLVGAPPPSRRVKYSAEVRKARHRDRMQRTRMAEKHDIEVKRSEMEALESQLEHSISGYLRHDNEEAESDAFFERHADNRSLLRDGDCASISRSDSNALTVPAATLQRKYVGLVVQQDQIKRENAQLIVRIHDHQKYEKLVTGEFERANESTPGDCAAAAAKALELDPAALATSRGGYWLSFTADEPLLYFDALSWATCQSASAAAYSQMVSLQRGIVRPTAAPTEAFGWHMAYGTLGSADSTDSSSSSSGSVRMQHQFCKRIVAASALPFALTTTTTTPAAAKEPVTIDSIGANLWEIMNSSELYKQIYKTDMVSKVLQRLDDNASVLLRTYPDEQREMRSRFLSLIHRIDERVADTVTGETRRRIVILLSVLDPNTCLKTATGSITSSASSGPATWLRDGMAYLVLTDVGDGDIEFGYGGYLNVASEALEPAVMRNMLEALLRLEQAAAHTDMTLLALS